MSAWVADLCGYLQLVEFIKQEGIDLVVIDSEVSDGAKCHQLLRQQASGRLLTYFKEVICPLATVVWRSTMTGHKELMQLRCEGMEEVPSMVHRLSSTLTPKPRSPARATGDGVVRKTNGRCREFYSRKTAVR